MDRAGAGACFLRFGWLGGDFRGEKNLDFAILLADLRLAAGF